MNKWARKLLCMIGIHSSIVIIQPYGADYACCGKPYFRVKRCSHEWHADQENDCNTCIKCGARQEIYYDPPYDNIPINGDTPNDD